jgi:hypothetical protein
MNRFLSLVLIAVAMSGCVTPPEKRPIRANLPSYIVLEQTFKIYGYGLEKSHWAELPLGKYSRAFEKDGNTYYMREDPKIMIRTMFPETLRPGGIVYWKAEGRFRAFAAIEGPVSIQMGAVMMTTGEFGKLSPFPMGIIADEILSQFKDEANQPLEPTPIAVTPRAGARVAPATGVAHL